MPALPFQVHANYGTWSIDFDLNNQSSKEWNDDVCIEFQYSAM